MIPSATALMSEPSRDSPIARALSRNSRDVLEEEEGAEEDDEEKAETNIYIYGCLLYPPVINPSPHPPDGLLVHFVRISTSPVVCFVQVFPQLFILFVRLFVCLFVLCN
jgi:hypothetical protein